MLFHAKKASRWLSLLFSLMLRRGAKNHVFPFRSFSSSQVFSDSLLMYVTLTLLSVEKYCSQLLRLPLIATSFTATISSPENSPALHAGEYGATRPSFEEA